MNTYDRRYLAATAAIEAWQNVAGPSRAIEDAFADEGLTATEEEFLCGLEAVRRFKDAPGLAAGNLKHEIAAAIAEASAE